MNLLFICSRNQWRSRTAETIFKDKHGFSVQSAGTSPAARIRITERMLNHADMVFVMEKKHKQIIQQKFGHIAADLLVLDIPDDYQYMDEELIELLEVSVMQYFEAEE